MKNSFRVLVYSGKETYKKSISHCLCVLSLECFDSLPCNTHKMILYYILSCLNANVMSKEPK